MNIQLTEAEKLFCQAISADDEVAPRAAVAWVKMVGDEAAFHFASANQVASLVAHSLARQAGFASLPAGWRQAHATTSARVSAYLTELDGVAAALAQKDIPVVALKNGGIARAIYPCPGCCPMGDLDVLVEQRHFRQAHKILQENGYNLSFKPPYASPSISRAEKSGVAEYVKKLAGNEELWFELHWRPITGRWIRPDQEPIAHDLLARSIPVPGTIVRLLSPEDNLLQVSLHTARHSFVRAPGFRLHTDVDRIVCGQVIDWDVFLQRATALQVKTAVYFSLLIPKELFNTPVPAPVLERLRPHPWKEKRVIGWLQQVGLFNPDQPKFGRLGYILFTILLYDDVVGLLRAVFPGRAYMRRRYQIRSGFLLPLYYLRRLGDLAFRHLDT